MSTRDLIQAARLVAVPAPLVILAFHRVVAGAAAAGGARLDPTGVRTGETAEGIETAALDWLVPFLQRHYRLASLEHAVDSIQADPAGARARPFVVLSFDDGFRDFHDLAYPVLRRHRAPATLFLVTGCTGTGRLLWFVKLDSLLERVGGEALRAAALDLDPGLGERGLAEPGPAGALRDFFRRRLAVTERERLLDGLWRRFPDGEESKLASRLFHTWDEIREMAQNGIEIGAHTVNHPDLSTLDDQGLEQEIAGSQREIAAQTGRAVRSFAYPWGDPASVTPQAVAVLGRAGFRAAVTSSWGANLASDDPYRLRRKGRRFGSRTALWLEMRGVLDLARKLRPERGPLAARS